jgi:hypothetical protein
MVDSHVPFVYRIRPGAVGGGCSVYRANEGLCSAPGCVECSRPGRESTRVGAPGDDACSLSQASMDVGLKRPAEPRTAAPPASARDHQLRNASGWSGQD